MFLCIMDDDTNSSLVRGHRSSLYSFIVGHCIKRTNALFMIGIHGRLKIGNDAMHFPISYHRDTRFI
jgi:hypothetical protein